MSEDNSYIGVDNIDNRIEEQERKTEKLKMLKDTLDKAGINTYVYVEARPDSPTIHVVLKADVVTNAMKAVARMDTHFKGSKSNPDKLQYDIEEQGYILDKKFRTDR
jgi:uncharacterized protein YcgL (UPF0745 family)